MAGTLAGFDAFCPSAGTRRKPCEVVLCVSPSQMGEFFGYSLVAADLTGDG